MTLRVCYRTMSVDVEERQTFTDTLCKTKEIGHSGGVAETPVKANRVDVLQENEAILDEARSVNEVLLEFSSNDLDDIDPSSVTPEGRSIDDVLEKSREDELCIPIVNYTGRSTITEEQALRLVTFLDEHFEIVGIPLNSKPLNETELDENPGPINRYHESVDRILSVIEELDVESSFFGTIPAISWAFVSPLLDSYLEHGVDGIVVDFLGKKPTAKSRVRDLISPLMEELGKHRIHRNTLLYAVNAYRGANRGEGDRSPAEDFLAIGLGFDVIGGIYYRARTGWADDEANDFRCFFRSSWEHEFLEIPSLAANLPTRTGFDSNRVQRIAPSDGSTRVEFLLESEQMNLACNDLREAVTEGGTVEYLSEKAGVTDAIQNRFEAAHQAYETGSSNPAIGSF